VRPPAAPTNDETLLVIHSPQLTKHFTREMDRLWESSEPGITPQIRCKLDRQKIRCEDRVERGMSSFKESKSRWRQEPGVFSNG